MREIILDTETTGLDPARGDRVIEICALEMVDGLLTGDLYHQVLNPERDIPPEATAVHGLSWNDVADKPRFADIAKNFLDFLGSSPVVAHNAPFDMGFLNAELRLAGLEPLDTGRAIDTVALAKKMFPGARVSLDALCARFNIDTSARTKHSARVDTLLLAEVYIELQGGKQRRLHFEHDHNTTQELAAEGPLDIKRVYREPRPHPPLATSETEAHAQFIHDLPSPLWHHYNEPHQA